MMESPSIVPEPYYVMLTEPNGESRACDHLTDQGFEPYCPMFTKVVVREVRRLGLTVRRSMTRLAPIFTGYLFLPVPEDRTVADDCPGLRAPSSRWLTIDGKRKTLSPKDLSDIKRIEAFANFDQIYRIGDRVFLLDGPFADHTATIAQLDDRARVRLLFEIFGRQTTVFASAEQISKTD
jgi:hypothetical protein